MVDGESTNERKPWEFGRFVRTATFFGAYRPPSPVDLLRKQVFGPEAPVVYGPGTELWTSANIWGSIWLKQTWV